MRAETIVGRDGGFLPLRRYRDFYDAAAGGKGNLSNGSISASPSEWDWDTLDYLGVRFFVSFDELPAVERSVLDAKGFRLAARQAYVLLWERPPHPPARLVHAVDVVPDEAGRPARLAADYPLGRRSLVERPVTLDPAPDPGTETVRTTHTGQRSVELETSSPARSLLTLADPWYPQWRVTVDGKPAELLVVDHAFRGVVVPAGAHRVRFSYEDDRLRLGLLLAGLTLVGLAGAAAAPRLRRRRVQTRGRGEQ